MIIRSIVLLSIFFTGCSSFNPKPIEQPVKIPDRWHIETDTGELVSTRWWEAFGDENLNRLVERALSNNPDLAATAQAVLQADLQLRNAGAALLPSFGVSGNTGKQVSKASGQDRVTTGSTSLGLMVDYELDLWGRLSTLEAAALADFQATEFDYEAARMTLAASVATTWFEWQELQHRVDIARRNLELGEKTLSLVEVQYRNGVVDRSELSRQRTAVMNLQNEVPPLEYQARQRLAALRLLTGGLSIYGGGSGSRATAGTGTCHQPGNTSQSGYSQA